MNPEFKTGDLVEVDCTPYDVPISIMRRGVIVEVYDAIGHSQQPAYDVLVDGERRMYRDSHLRSLRKSG